MSETAALWLAGIFATALTLILGTIATAVMRERTRPAAVPSLVAVPTLWEQERGAVFERMDNVESEVRALRKDRHDEANRVTRILGDIEMLKREDDHLRERMVDLREGR